MSTTSNHGVFKISDINVGERFRENYGDIEELQESIERHGVIQPITICPSLSGEGVYDLVAGSRRLRASALLEKDTIPAVVREVKDEADLREIELVENIHRKDLDWVERCWLEEKIVDLKGSQAAAAEVLEHSIGLTNRYVQMARAMRMIPELSGCKNMTEAFRQLKKFEESVIVESLKKKADSAMGVEHDSDSSELDKLDARTRKRIESVEHFYNIGDAIEGMKAIENYNFQFAEVDPPYGIDLADQKRTSTSTDINVTDGYTEVKPEEYGKWTLEVAEEVYRLLDYNTYCIWWFAPSQGQTVKNTLLEVGFEVDDIPAVWVKPNGQTQQPNVHLARCYEPFYIARKGRPVLHKPGSKNVFAYKPVSPNQKVHPTERPLELIQDLIDTFCYPGYAILCPFMGSGKTLVAAITKDMHAYGWALNPEYKESFYRLCISHFAEGGEEGDVQD